MTASRASLQGRFRRRARDALQMSRFRFLRAPVHAGSMASVVAQEAFMKWDRIQMGWEK
jgi:hypothetical protein